MELVISEVCKRSEYVQTIFSHEKLFDKPQFIPANDERLNDFSDISTIRNRFSPDYGSHPAVIRERRGRMRQDPFSSTRRTGHSPPGLFAHPFRDAPIEKSRRAQRESADGYGAC
ncbi:hypothetical protein O3V59_01300 [Brevibacillus thermoruber]|uniref:Uncharacterized protein n=1 Tax=Brevibacillus thermoruber TaxID=33942 RepID=A0A9X3TN16_9BACL|nr:hypothetical protein [Brevibacillus thermoruber]MDA5106988.1 hypothetical protein [Brevibacillus thermoruber]